MDALSSKPAVSALVQELIDAAWSQALRRSTRPQSTYRLQLFKGFTFQQATALTDYLHALGITHAYASSYLRATPGSTHGYDVIDHCRLNPDIGTDEDYQAWVKSLRDAGMGHVLDTVPNHVGVATNENNWWNSVLEHGPASPYGNYFDIAWRGSPRPQLHDRVLLPLLGDLYAKVLEKGELKLTFKDGAFAVQYYDRVFPIDPKTYVKILIGGLEELRRELGEGHAAVLEIESICDSSANLPGRAERDVALSARRRRESEVIKRRIAVLVRDEPAVAKMIQRRVEAFNGTKGDPRSFDLLDGLLSDQCYRLSYWHVASDEINYRRFFDVNSLAALSMEREEVFRDAHQFIMRLLAEERIDGLRIDHPDGLYDPRQYFQRLQRAYLQAIARRLAGENPKFASITDAEIEAAVRERLRSARQKGEQFPLYVVAEKILAVDEPLPEEWACDGTSGYDFLNMANGLFVDGSAEAAFTRTWQRWTGDTTSFEDLIYRKKLLILEISLASELQMLTFRLDELAQKDRHYRDFTRNALRHALRELIACFPVYRSYISARGVQPVDREHIDTAVASAKRRNPKVSPAIFDFIRDTLLLKYPASMDEAGRTQQRTFAGKFQQVTAPVTAKGIEDTAFYIYNRLTSLNEVGGDPGKFGVALEELHHYLADRQKNWPHAMSTLSTHDTKRSEDVRARINVLSEMPEEWDKRLQKWGEMNRSLRSSVHGLTAPSPDEESLIYQTLLGAWPLEKVAGEAQQAFVKRIQEYLLKAMHEAKLHTSWRDPDGKYEEAVVKFIADLCTGDAGAAFREDFLPLQKRISHYGLLNSLSQTLLKLTAPGEADTYQGTELWDFSLVDPDNRRPVDYELRRRLLRELQRTERPSAALARELVEKKDDGRVKLYTVWRTLVARRDHPELFSDAEYIPLQGSGEFAAHLFGFARRHENQSAIVVVPRLMSKLSKDPIVLPVGSVWGNTQVNGAPNGNYRNVFTGATVAVKGAVAMSELLKDFPVGLLIAE